MSRLNISRISVSRHCVEQKSLLRKQGGFTSTVTSLPKNCLDVAGKPSGIEEKIKSVPNVVGVRVVK